MRANAFSGYILVVDTDEYTGSFERPMTAFATGCIGECGVGQEQSEMFKKDVPLEIGERIDSIIDLVPDEHGCCRPTSIYPTPGFFNDGLGNEWPDSEWGKAKVKSAYQKAAKKAGIKQKSPDRYPSYQSVAMYFSQKPDNDLLDLMVERIRKFCASLPMKYGPDKVNILGIRLIQEEMVAKEIARIL